MHFVVQLHVVRIVSRNVRKAPRRNGVGRNVLIALLRCERRRVCLTAGQRHIKWRERCSTVHELTVDVDGQTSIVLEAGIPVALLVPENGDQRAMIGQIFDGEIRPIARHQRANLQPVVQCGDYANQIAEYVVDVSRMKVVFAVVDAQT